MREDDKAEDQMTHFPVQLEDRLKEAWGLFAKAPEIFITIAFALFGVSVLLNTMPVVGQLITILLGALGPAAFFLAADECSRTGTACFDSLKKLSNLFPQLLALFVVKTILIGIGFCLLVIPGIYLAVLLCFSELFVVVEGKPFVEAMKASKGLVQGSWWRVFGLFLVVGMIFLSGALLVGLGLLLTAPYAAILLYCAFRKSHVQVVG